MMDELIRLVVYLTVASVAVERAVDIVKRAVIQKLNITTLNGAAFQILAGIFGCIIAFTDQPSFDFVTTNRWLLVVVIYWTLHFWWKWSLEHSFKHFERVIYP